MQKKKKVEMKIHWWTWKWNANPHSKSSNVGWMEISRCNFHAHNGFSKSFVSCIELLLHTHDFPGSMSLQFVRAWLQVQAPVSSCGVKISQNNSDCLLDDYDILLTKFLFATSAHLFLWSLLSSENCSIAC